MSTWVIFGSGPTLDDADFDALPANRIAVNRAIDAVPNCEFVSCVDPCREGNRTTDYLQGKKRIVNDFTVETYALAGSELEYHAKAEKVGGSTGTALAFAVDMGADKVIMYGVGGEGRARKLDNAYRDLQINQTSQTWYAEVLEKCKVYAEAHGVELEIR